MIFTTRYESPFGPITVCASEKGLRAILFNDPSLPSGETVTKKCVLNPQAFPTEPLVYNEKRLAKTIEQLDLYFNGHLQEFRLPIDLGDKGTSFQRSVWQALQEIPYGATVTYGELAKRIGNEKAARAVGLANNRNPLAIVIPCHRVIGANGFLVGYAGGLAFKQSLLQLEGVSCKTNEDATSRDNIIRAGVVAFSKLGYRGARIDEIATTAGINKRMIYHYFGSKRGLYDEIQSLLLADTTSAAGSRQIVNEEEKLRLQLFRLLDQDPLNAFDIEEEIRGNERQITKLVKEGEIARDISVRLLARLQCFIHRFGGLFCLVNQPALTRDDLQELIRVRPSSKKLTRLLPLVRRMVDPTF